MWRFTRTWYEKSCRIQEIDGSSCLVEMGVKNRLRFFRHLDLYLIIDISKS